MIHNDLELALVGLLRELDFKQDDTFPAYYRGHGLQILAVRRYGAKSNATYNRFRFQLEDNKESDFIELPDAVEFLKDYLREAGYPVDYKLRMKRLNALIS